MPSPARPLPGQPVSMPVMSMSGLPLSLGAGAGPVPQGRGGPLAGMTVLVVEDSRAACEGLRLSCLRLGARLRRAATMDGARRHLGLYRPDVLLVDMGLPDGPGETLLAEVAVRAGRPAVVLAISGLPERRTSALAAGADGFLEKPLPGPVALFDVLRPRLAEAGCLRQGPVGWVPVGRALAGMAVTAAADPQALRDDLFDAQRLLSAVGQGQGVPAHLPGFLAGLGRLTGDPALIRAARAVDGDRTDEQRLAELARLVADRIARLPECFDTPDAGGQGAGRTRQS